MVQLLITGGLGFLGQQAARRFLRPNAALWSPVDRCFKPLSQLTLFDQSLPTDQGALPHEIKHDPRVRVLTGDITEPGVTEELVDDPDISVIHLASMVSGDSEVEPDRAWSVNVLAQRGLLEALRSKAPMARFLLTSSTATFGAVRDGAAPPGDQTKQVPGNTYGFHKVVCEMMLNEYSRRGYQTASAAIEHLLVHVPDASLRRLGHDRVFTLPSLSLSPAELHAAAAELAEARGLTLGAMEEAPTELATRVVQSMGGAADGSRAQQLGLPQDESAASIVEGYARDYVFEAAHEVDA